MNILASYLSVREAQSCLPVCMCFAAGTARAAAQLHDPAAE